MTRASRERIQAAVRESIKESMSVRTAVIRPFATRKELYRMAGITIGRRIGSSVENPAR